MPTTADYLTQLQQDREDLVDNLETKGIDDLTGDETFTELVPRVLDIEGGGSEQKYRLPNQYQEVEYIGITDGNGYIDTEFTPTYFSKAVVKGLMTSGTFLLGEDTSWANKGFGILARYSYFSNKWTSVSISLNVLYDFTVSKDGYYWGSTLKDSFSGASTFTADYSLYVFANHRNGSPDEYGKGRIYSLDLYEDDVLTKQFIPCYEKATNIIGLYDLVGEKFHGSQGSGTWIKGEDHDVPKENLQDKTVIITENTTTNVEPDTGYDGLSSVEVITSVPTSDATLLPRYDSYFFTSYIQSSSTSVGAGNVQEFSPFPAKNELFKRTTPKKGLICFFVRSNYTIPSDLVLLAETDWHISNDPIKQKLVICWCNNLSQSYTIQQENSGRMETYSIVLKNTSVPTNILLNTTLNITEDTNPGFLEVYPTNKMCIYICSSIYNYNDASYYFDDKFDFSDITERMGIFISTNNIKKRVGTNNNSYGVIGIELEYNAD